MDNIETAVEHEVEQDEINHDEVDDSREEQQAIRDTLARNFSADDEAKSVEKQTAKVTDETPAEATPEQVAQVTQEAQTATPAEPVQRPILLPPADMNKMEKEAFLNPTPDNAHILQQYMNRRAYETRTDYQRKMQEVEQLKQQTSSIYDTIKQYENDYAKHGISIADITKRSIAWDKAMQADPITTAREWLESYGLKIEDLTSAANNYQQQQQAPQQYLTKEEAEQLADARWSALKAEQEKNAVAYYNERVVESFVARKPLFKDPETASQIEAEMAPIVSALSSTGRYSSPEEILETAYNYVVNGNPTFSSIHQAMTARPVIEQKQVAVQKAKAASRSITGSAGSGTPRIEAKNMRDNLRRRMTGE
jgi:hypothetical protein